MHVKIVAVYKQSRDEKEVKWIAVGRKKKNTDQDARCKMAIRWEDEGKNGAVALTCYDLPVTGN